MRPLQPSATVNANPATVAVLRDYALRKLHNHEEFWISDELNSDVLRDPSGFGGFLDSVTAAASKVASTVVKVAEPVAKTAAAVNTIKAATGGNKTSGGGNSNASQVASAILPQVQAQLRAQGVALPGEIQQQTVAASILDSFGPQYHNVVLYGGLALGVLLLAKFLG